MSQVVVTKQRCPHVVTQRHYSLLYVHLLLKKHTDFLFYVLTCICAI